MDAKKIQQQIENLEKRVTALEASVVESKGRNKNHKIKTKEKAGLKYSGPKGGILLLIEEGFFKVKKTVHEVWATLEKKGYVYKKEVIQTALNRLSKPTGPLVKMESDGKKIYVERK